MTVESVIAELKKKGTEQTRKTYARHGHQVDRVLGVSSADMKLIAKSLKAQQDLALKLYQTGFMEAMYTAGMVAAGAKMTPDELQSWAEGSTGLPMISEHTVPWVTVENARGPELAVRWMDSAEEQVAACGWRSYAGMTVVTADDDLDLKEIERLLKKVVQDIGKAQNRARYTMNGFVIAVGTYVKPMLGLAQAAAQAIGRVNVEMGDTACKVTLASEALGQIAASGQAGKKRKTIRC